MNQFLIRSKLKLAITLFVCSGFVYADVNTVDIININADQSNLSQWQFSDGVSAISSSLVSVVNNPNIYITGSAYLNNADTISNPNYTGFWTANFNFNVSNINNNLTAAINITNFSADDRAEMFLNGQLIDAVSIFGPTAPEAGVNPKPVFQSIYASDPTNANYIPTSFNAENSSLSLNVSNLFNGSNDLEIIVNNTNHGAIGVTRLPTEGDATSFGLSGTIQYFVTAVPVPSSIMLFGTGLLSFLVFQNRKKFVTIQHRC